MDIKSTKPATVKMLKIVSKQLLPPIIFNIYKAFKGRGQEKFGWFGNYNSWNEALELSSGYDSDIILQKVSSSLLKVKNKEAVYERDGVLFDQIEYSWPLLAAFLRISAERDGVLNVLDFGGSLGSTYFQNKDFLTSVRKLKWNIVEQPRFVETGKKLFENEILSFYSSIDECLNVNECNIIILSSVVQYLEFPHELIDSIISRNIEYIFFDRTPFIQSDYDVITIQEVPESIYRASYPCHFFNENRFTQHFLGKYDTVFSFKALDTSNIKESYFKGFLFKYK